MARNRQRVCLEDGLKLDLNRLASRGFIKFGANIGSRGIVWNHSYWGEVERAVISADMTSPRDAWLKVQFGESIQRIELTSRVRHFGGRQWFFVCPATGRRATVLWKPPGAQRFCSRQTWGRQVAYRSQYLDRDSRAHAAQSKINALLCLIGGFDPEDWDLPTKPKWMRWKTYHRHEAKFDHYEAVLDYCCAAMAAKLTGLKIL